MANGASARSAVAIAVDLGWRLAELYDAPALLAQVDRERTRVPDHLPGFGEMTPHEKACALSAHVGADLAALKDGTGTDLPTATTIDEALGVSGQNRDAVRSVILDLYTDVRNRLAGGDPAVALAFGLGRMLADTALLPTTEHAELLSEQFEQWRLSNAFEWLDDLDAALPARAASAVGESLRAWERWVSQAAAKTGSPVNRSGLDATTVRALRRQGNVRRRLLTGEQPAAHLLDATAYVGAAARLLAKVRRLTFHYAWKWSWAIISALAGIAAAVWAAVTYAPAGTSRIAAILVSAGGFLGVSWTGIRATLGRALRRAETAMWEAEVVAAIGRAATILPKKKLDQPEAGPLFEREDPELEGHCGPSKTPAGRGPG
jgi:hypothetical protein